MIGLHRLGVAVMVLRRIRAPLSWHYFAVFHVHKDEPQCEIGAVDNINGWPVGSDRS